MLPGFRDSVPAELDYRCYIYETTSTNHWTSSPSESFVLILKKVPTGLTEILMEVEKHVARTGCERQRRGKDIISDEGSSKNQKGNETHTKKDTS